MTEHDFVELVRSETGLEIGAEHLPLTLDELDRWDSMFLITVVTAVEGRTGRSVPVADALECGSLDELRELTTT